MSQPDSQGAPAKDQVQRLLETLLTRWDALERSGESLQELSVGLQELRRVVMLGHLTKLRALAVSVEALAQHVVIQGEDGQPVASELVSGVKALSEGIGDIETALREQTAQGLLVLVKREMYRPMPN